MARFLKRSPRRTLTLANFPHLERDTAAAVGLLRAALGSRRNSSGWAASWPRWRTGKPRSGVWNS